MKKFLCLLLGMSCFFTPIIAEDGLSLRERYFDLQRKSGGIVDANIDHTVLRDRYLDLLKQNILGNETMISIYRLDGLLQCMKEVVENEIPGDFIETGVWRGGATIFMKGFLTAFEDRERRVWVADSFEGFPPTSRGNELSCNNENYPHLAVSLETVKSNFSKYQLLDNQVVFLKGFFSETLPVAPIEKLAILRLDGDLYASTMDALESLYPKLSVGGYIIIDDFGHWPGCADAVLEYREAHNIHDEIIWEDYTGIHWKKSHD